MPDELVNVHSIVDDVETAVAFYTTHFGCTLRAAGLTLRNDLVSGPGGPQMLLEDPAGNPIELVQPAGA